MNMISFIELRKSNNIYLELLISVAFVLLFKHIRYHQLN
jgi:hypothetical protein